MAPQIFPEEGFVSGSKLGKIWKGANGKARFEAETLEKIIKDLVANKFETLGPDAMLEKMYDKDGDPGCRT